MAPGRADQHQRRHRDRPGPPPVNRFSVSAVPRRWWTMSIETYHLPDTQDDFPTNSDVYVPTRRRSLSQSQPEPPAPAPAPKQPFLLQKHPWGSFLVGMALCLILFLFGRQLVIPFVSATYDQWHYGDARLTQLDADVGHGGTSHFIASYYHGHIVVIELLLSHPQENQVYLLSG